MSYAATLTHLQEIDETTVQGEKQKQHTNNTVDIVNIWPSCLFYN